MSKVKFQNYINRQRNLIKLEYELETKEKQKTKMPEVDLNFILRANRKNRFSKSRIWTTTLPLPKNLIAPEYLIINDPTYVNTSDKIKITFLDNSKAPIEGTVIKIRDGELTAKFELDWIEDSLRKKCSIEFYPNDVVFKRKLDALKRLNQLSQPLKKMLCREYPKNRNLSEKDLILPKGYEFNDSQRLAINMAVSNPFSIIQGPPGTGKTHTIGAIAIQSLKNEPDKKVLICGTTNVSINSLLEIVGDMVQSEGYKVCWPASSVRDFSSEKDLSKEQKLTTLYLSLHMNSPYSKEFKKLFFKRCPTERERKRMAFLRKKLEDLIVKQSNVIFSTLDSSGKSSILNISGRISTLIVDEATLSVESSMIIPLSLCPDRFVLVGDHKQLGPSPSFKELQIRGFYCSMFERIIKEQSCHKNSVMLNTQYRMHPDISSLPNSLFYDNELIDGVRPEERKISKSFILQKHFNFININGNEEKNGTSFINMDEINQVVKFVHSLIDSGVNNSQIGVITAYGAQASLISQNFKSNNLRVKISTIDSFQGSQKDYIIICTTRNGENIGFLSDQRRMNVAITRARCLVAIFGNANTLAKSHFWNEVIQYAKRNNSFYEKLPIKFVKYERKAIIITKGKGESVRELVSEFKEEVNDAGYLLREIKSEISDENVRVLWPDEKNDIDFLENWTKERINLLKKNYHVTLSYDAESVCMQFGDIFDKNVNFYNWDPSEYEVPEIKTSQSFIISFYRHKDDHQLDPTLVNIMKPLLEHPRITLVTFDFTYDFDKLYEFGINIKTTKIIDVQLLSLPEKDILNENDDDYICSTGWKPISEFICQANDNNINGQLIFRAKNCIKNGKKKFPHEENDFLIDHYNLPQICKFTKTFLEYSAEDIFYTAIAAVDLISRGELDIVKERSSKKFKSYKKYRNKYGNAKCVRNAYYVRESLTSAVQAQFSSKNETCQLLSYYKKISAFYKLFNEHSDALKNIIPSFDENDYYNIKKRYEEIVKIIKNPEDVHLGYVKYQAYLSHVKNVSKNPAFILRQKDEADQV